MKNMKIENFQSELSSYGYKLQFVSLAGFHSLASSMYDLASKYKGGNMSAILELQQFEKDLSKDGYTGIKRINKRLVGITMKELVKPYLEMNQNYFQKKTLQRIHNFNRI